MAGKTIYVISDLHMGDGGPRDNFAYEETREQEIDSFLEFVKRENGELIILGDLFDFWQANVGRVLVKRKYWLNRFADMKATYVVGNHDIDLAGFINEDESIDSDFLGHRFFKKMKRKLPSPTIGGKKFGFMHGHEIDPPNMKETPGSGRIATIFAGIVEDIVGAPMVAHQDKSVEEALLEFYTKIEQTLKLLVQCLYMKIKGEKVSQMEEYMTPAQKPERAGKILDLYKSEKEKNGYDVVVVGHTHQAGKRGDWYYNSGCWASKKNSFIRINTDGKVEVFDWVNGKEEPNKTEL